MEETTSTSASGLRVGPALLYVAVALCVTAAFFTAYSIYGAAFYSHHGYSPLGLDVAQPVYSFEFFANYLWLLSLFLPHTEAVLHINRIFWVIVAALSFAFFVWHASNSAAATFLCFVLFLNMPTLASSRLWSLSAGYNIASSAGCICLALECVNLRRGTRFRRRFLAAFLYGVSVLIIEFFFFAPFLIALFFVVYHGVKAEKRTAAFNWARSVLAWYAVPLLLASIRVFAMRKHFANEGPLGIVGHVISVPYLKSVIAQVTSNIGDRFFMFLIDNLVSYYTALSTATLIYIGVFSVVVTLVFAGLNQYQSDRVSRELTAGPSALIKIGLLIVVLAAISNSFAIYTYSLGSLEDRINQASAIGAAMALTGLLIAMLARGGASRFAGILCCVAILFSMTKIATLEAHDWRRVRRWDAQLNRDYANYASSRPKVVNDIVVVHGFPRFVSSFEFNPKFIWLSYFYPRYHGIPGANYRLQTDEIDRLRDSWKGRFARHFDRGYRYWPLLIAPFHPTAEDLDAVHSVTLIHVDRDFGVECTPDAIILPSYQKEEITPLAVKEMLFAEWREDQDTTFKRVSVRDCRSVASVVNVARD
jgi:hypothetical protein